MVEDAASFAAEDRVLGPSYQALTGFRIALTAEQVDFYDLPTAPVKATDSRAWRWEGGTCQLEALPPDELHRIIENAIAERIADEALAHVLDDEETDRAELLSLPPANRRRGSDCHEHGPTNPRRRPDGN